MLQRGALVDQGTHDELLQRCGLYRRIFAHYDEVAHPEAVPAEVGSDGRADGPDGAYEADGAYEPDGILQPAPAGGPGRAADLDHDGEEL